MKTKLLLILIFFFLISCSDNSTNTIDTGIVKGKLVISEQYEDYNQLLFGARVYVMGTNGYALTDSSGSFSISGIPPGTYSIYAYSQEYYYLYGTAENIKVEADKITEIPDIVLGREDYTYDSNCYLTSLYIQDSLGYQHSFGYNYWFSEYKNISVLGRLYCSSSSGAYRDTVISIKLNNTRYITTTQKQRFNKSLTLDDGLNTIAVWMGDTDSPESDPDTSQVYYNVTKRPLSIYLMWDSYEHDYVDAGDFDIHLINEQTGDSCWYKNTNPDWGIPGINFDNPYLSPGENFYGSYSETEYLLIDHTADGTYTLKVHYFTNRSDSTIAITPEVRIQLRDQYLEYTSPGLMHVGDLWTVTQITIPYHVTSIASNRIIKSKMENDKRPMEIEIVNRIMK